MNPRLRESNVHTAQISRKTLTKGSYSSLPAGITDKQSFWDHQTVIHPVVTFLLFNIAYFCWRCVMSMTGSLWSWFHIVKVSIVCCVLHSVLPIVHPVKSLQLRMRRTDVNLPYITSHVIVHTDVCVPAVKHLFYLANKYIDFKYTTATHIL